MIVRYPRADQPLLADSHVRVYQTPSIGLRFTLCPEGMAV